MLIRTTIMAAAVFAWGSPAFDGLRPGVLDRSLQAFHREMTLGARQSYRDATVFIRRVNVVRSFGHMDPYVERMNAAIRRGPATPAPAANP